LISAFFSGVGSFCAYAGRAKMKQKAKAISPAENLFVMGSPR
jgi:hypothetical protein